jgi:hypothetical protein
MIQEISSFEQLQVVVRQFGLTSIVGRVPRFRFVIAGLPEATNREATERMSNYQSECGCFAGGLTMGASVLAFIILFIVSGRSPVGGGFRGVAWFFVLLVVSTLAGKLLGLLWARVRMVRLMRKMAARAERELFDGPGRGEAVHGASL